MSAQEEWIRNQETISDLKKELAEAQKDQERLDFMTNNRAFICWSRDHECCNVWVVAGIGDDSDYPYEGYPQKNYDTPRQAIDAAMKVKP